MNALRTKVVIIDDDLQFLELMTSVASALNFQVDAFAKTEDFWKNQYNEFDLLVLDLSMPGCDGIEFIRKLAQDENPMQLILCSGQDRDILKAAEDLAIAHKLNFVTALQKPVSIKHFRKILTERRNSLTRFNRHQVDLKLTRERLLAAIAHNEIKPFYQPQIDMSNDQLIGFEALCRWESPDYGVVPPNLFLPAATECGLLFDITQLMLKKSSFEIGKLSEEINQELHISVNIDASDVTSLSFPEFITSILEFSKLKPNQLMLEITESGMMGQLTQSLDILARLRMKGVSLSIDDFGTGYSSLSMLHKMPFNELKIDQSFVKTMLTDLSSLAIVETCILLAKKLGVKTVAEGIETVGSYNYLRELGCDYGQGYLIGKPMPYQQIQPWLAEWQNNENLAAK